MGKWEWRAFLTDEQQAREIYTALAGQAPNLGGGETEERVDEYLPGLPPSLGIKLRGGQGLEAKLRTERKKRGAEMWVKKEFARGLEAGVLAEMKAWVQAEGGAEAELSALDALARGGGERERVPVSKRRVKVKTPNKLAVDFSEVTVPHMPVVWSVAVEGKNSKDLYAALEMAWAGGASAVLPTAAEHHGDGAAAGELGQVCMGYPSFVSQAWSDGGYGAHESNNPAAVHVYVV